MALIDQITFTKNIPLLINKAFELGYSVTLGDAFRDHRVHGSMGYKKGYGAANSFHKIRQAIDLNLFDAKGQYLSDAHWHAKLGAYWKSLGGTWGGDFRDANHYSWGEK